jgi:hypothetical protein
MFELTSWITEYGLTEDMIALVLYIPILATLINVSRYVFGFKTLGIYAPLSLSFAYIFTGIRFGLLITVAVIVASLISYSVLKKVRMHYISRITITYIIVAILVIIIILANEASPISITTNKHNVAMVSPLGIVIIATLSDFFIKKYVKKSISTSIRSSIETVFIAVIGWALLRSTVIKEFALEYTIILLILLLVINLVVGQSPVMRLREYARFKPATKK